jgi:hypothetical protein
LGVIIDEVARINVFSTSTPVNIPELELDVPASRPASSLVSLYVTQGDIFDPLDVLQAVGLNFDGLDIPSEDEHRIRFACAIAGDISGPIRVGQVRRLQADGNVRGDVVAGFAYAPDNVSIGAISVGGIGRNITAGQSVGDVRVLGTGPVWSGRLDVLSGGIQSIQVPNGILGGATASENPFYGVRSADTIRRLIANQVDAVVESNVTTLSSEMQELAVNGAMNGRISVGRVRSITVSNPVRLLGNVAGFLRIDGLEYDDMLIASSSAGSEIIVTGAVSANIDALGPIHRLSVSNGFMAPDDMNRINLPSRCDNLTAPLGGLRARVLATDIGTFAGTTFSGSITGLNSAGSASIENIDFPGSSGLFILSSNRGDVIRLANVEQFRVGSVLSDVNEPFVRPLPAIQLDQIPPGANFVVDGRFTASLKITQPDGLRGNFFVNSRLCIPTAQGSVFSESVLHVGSVESALPFYQPAAGPLGGGYLAVAPYGLYESMCTPVDNSTGGDRITSTAFNREPNDNCGLDSPIKLHFYGPVQIFNPFLPAAKVQLMVNGVPYSDVSHRVTYRMNPANPREMLIEGKPGFPIPAGQYRVTNSTASAQALFCTPALPTGACAPGLAVSAFEYHFELLPDCAAPFCEPEANPTQECIALPSHLCDPIDFNNDGSLFDPTDIDAFLSVFSEGPCIPATAICNDVDFNNDGSGFDPCDIDAFNLVFAEGPCTACGQ